MEIYLVLREHSDYDSGDTEVVSAHLSEEKAKERAAQEDKSNKEAVAAREAWYGKMRAANPELKQFGHEQYRDLLHRRQQWMIANPSPTNWGDEHVSFEVISIELDGE